MKQILDSNKSLIQLVLGYLAIRIRSKQEIIQYLQGKTSNSEQIESVLNYLVLHHLIDDREFAKAWTESKLRKRKGDLFIKTELRQKGVAQTIIEEALNNIDVSIWNTAIENTVQKYKHKWESLTGYQKKSKIYALLRMRGFSSIHIDAFLNHKVE